MMRETYRQVVEQINTYPQECERLEEERMARLQSRQNRTEGRY